VKLSSVIGTLGEREAAAFLTAEGHEILCRNYRMPGAEIDLISMKDKVLYIIEVKASRTMDEDCELLERVDSRKIMRMKKAAGRYLSEHPVYYTEMRLSFLTVQGIGRSSPLIQFIDGSE
jgi:putative endonuclease